MINLQDKSTIQRFSLSFLAAVLLACLIILVYDEIVRGPQAMIPVFVTLTIGTVVGFATSSLGGLQANQQNTTTAQQTANIISSSATPPAGGPPPEGKV